MSSPLEGLPAHRELAFPPGESWAEALSGHGGRGRQHTQQSPDHKYPHAHRCLLSKVGIGDASFAYATDGAISPPSVLWTSDRSQAVPLRDAWPTLPASHRSHMRFDERNSSGLQAVPAQLTGVTRLGPRLLRASVGDAGSLVNGNTYRAKFQGAEGGRGPMPCSARASCVTGIAVFSGTNPEPRRRVHTLVNSAPNRRIWAE